MTFRGLCLVAGLLMGACAPLTAETPLFSLTDQLGPAPLKEGVWMQTNAACTPEMARAGASEACVRIEVSHEHDGSWRYAMRSTDESGVREDAVWRFILAPAVETARGEEYAPLYVAEYTSSDAPDQPFYAVVAPVGVMPASEVRMLAMVDCDDALRDGPIPGVREELGQETFEHLCVAANRTAVREAARRALIENLSALMGEDRTRFVWIAPLDDEGLRQLVEAR